MLVMLTLEASIFAALVKAGNSLSAPSLAGPPTVLPSASLEFRVGGVGDV
jgi:hypothetical protein